MVIQGDLTLIYSGASAQIKYYSQVRRISILEGDISLGSSKGSECLSVRERLLILLTKRSKIHRPLLFCLVAMVDCLLCDMYEWKSISSPYNFGLGCPKTPFQALKVACSC